MGYETPGYRNYMRDRIVEGGTADGDLWERAARAHMVSPFDGGEVPADLRGAVEVLQAQNQYAVTCHESRGMASTTATDTAQRERDRLIKRHLESNGGDLDKALESTARDLRRGPATGRTGFTRESNRRTTVRESMTATRATTSTVLVKIIDEGQGSSGYYPAHVLEAAAREKVFPKGTLMLVDHPTVAEDMGRPEGSVDRLAGHLTEDAYFQNGALYATAQINSRWSYLVDDMADVIGVSISAAADINHEGVVQRLIPNLANRVDIVTIAGRGGAFL